MSGQRAGVLGWPVAHSRSPEMHEAAYAAAGLTGWRYQRLPVPPELLAATIAALPGAGFAGANVTIPHKEAALAAATRATPTAQAIGAANTLTFAPDGAIEADNTDAPGFLAALGEDPGGMVATVLGAGGSARAVVWALREGGAAVRVWNRTPERAERLARELDVETTPELNGGDLLVSCIPAGHGLPAGAWATVVDLAYGDGETPLVREARRAGARTVDGLEVLVRQGALSFERWTGAPAPLADMRAAARS
ncbi:MAG TPA: shikimate dehydrogenase [Solirubrobacteraceae bacterium]|nr:shikimate dehydrogenase [Solirubrobacteraceae bacterium]